MLEIHEFLVHVGVVICILIAWRDILGFHGFAIYQLFIHPVKYCKWYWKTYLAWKKTAPIFDPKN